jgi:HK97 family phage prohead protease
MYDAWGGKSMLPWAKKKVEQMEEKNESQLSKLRNKYGENVELRTAEVRAAGDDSLVIEGYAANFEQRTDLGYFKEEIARGAFDDVMEDDVRLLLNHEGAPMARTTNGTLELSIDDTGLKYRAALADTQDGRDLYKLIKRGDITQSSFAFTIAEQEWSEDRSTRTVTKMARLLDVSPVTYPAYPTTTVAARQMAEVKPEPVEEIKTESKAQPEKQEVRTFEQTAEKTAKQFKIMNFRNSNDAARYISQLEDKLANINALAETEERALTSEELEETQEIHAKLEVAEQQRDGLAKNEQRLKARAVAQDAVVRSDKEAIKANAKFDFGKALREAAQGGVTGLEKEVMQEARKEASALGLGLRGDFSIPQSMLVEARNVYGVDSGQSGVNTAVTTVATEVTALVGALRSNSLLAATGATQLNGFVGDIKMPSLPTDAASEPAEGASVTSNSGAMGSQTLSPQRIAQQMIVTKEAINQTNGNMASVIAADFGRSIANVQDKIALNSISGVGGAAALAGGTGQIVLATETGTNDLAATDSEDIRDLWAAITANGAENNTAFVFHPTTYAHLLGQANVNSVSPLIENGSIFGYNVLNSGSVPVQDLSAVNGDTLIEGAAALAADGLTAVYFGYYGDWTDLFYANWGGLDVTVDPFSGISAGTVKIVVDTFFDAKVRRSGSLGAMVMANATIANADS